MTVARQATLLPPTARLLTVGSCFAGVLGTHLRAARLPVLDNPFGTVLNPIAACRLLAIAAGYDEYDLVERAVERDGRWYSFDAPSALHGATTEELREVIDAKLTEVREFVRTADALVLTMGTAWTWRLDGEVVANCHKQPGGLFQKMLLSVQQIVTGFAEMHSWLLRLNPRLRVVLTVSPVRHRKETLEGSSVSKATLRLACHHLAELVRDVAYFPAYELLLDDLRDYRFFAPDMLHPSALAEEYIVGKFAGAWLDERFAAAQTAWEEIDRALAHRSANPAGEAHQKFLLATLDKLDALAAQGFPTAAETAALTAQLTQPRARAAVQGSAPAAKPAKPVIKVELPTTPRPTAERPEQAPPAEPVSTTITSESTSEPTAAPAREERRGGRRNNRRGRGGRDRDGRRERPETTADLPAPVAADALTPAPETASEPLPEPQALVPPAAETPETAAPKKRRGRRGGRRHKHRRDGATADNTADFSADDAAPDESSAELTAATEAAAELAVGEVVPAAPVGEAEPVELLPAEEVALDAALEAAPEPAAEFAPEPTPGRKTPKPARTKATGGKKLMLQQVRPAVAAESPAKPEPTPQPAKTEKPPRAAKPARAPKPQPPVAEPVAPPTAPVAVPKPVAAAVPVVAPAPPAAPRKPRTPARSKVQGPVATPVEKAAAARAVKKAGVSALLAALGGSGAPAPAAPPAPPPAEAPAPKSKRPAAKPRTPKTE